ncbi:MAG: endonuclease/exonuclease/phosphatase family protein [Bacteriovoracaceae bacterium]|nr:endonuclease/exonuclease/phosphatase family protein [Bacteriovoracaceae bacterium]
MKKIKIASYNLFAIPFYSPNAKARLATVENKIREGNWDLIGLQEDYYWGRHLRWRDERYQVIKHKHKGLFGTGNTQLSRFPIIESNFEGFSHQGTNITDRLSGKGLGELHFKFEGEDFIFFNTHLLPPAKRETTRDRLTQLNQILERLKKIPTGTHIIMTGDFNMTPNHEEFKFYQEMTGLHAAKYEGSTFCESNSFNSRTLGAIDHIWVSKDLEITGSTIHKLKHFDSDASDHFLVEAEIVLK